LKMSSKPSTYVDELLELSQIDSRLPDDKFGQTPYEMFCVEPAIYEKYKEEISRLGLAYQEWVASEEGGPLLERVDQLTDQEIAIKLDLDEELVRKIRCMADWDIPMEMWRNAAEFKRRSRLDKPMGASTRAIKGEPG
jgi:hypothetical protein